MSSQKPTPPPHPGRAGGWGSLTHSCNPPAPALQVWLLPSLSLKATSIPTPGFLSFPRGSAGKESACSAGNLGSIPGLGRSPGEGKGYPLQYSGLESSMNCTVHGVAKSQTRLSDFPSLYSLGVPRKGNSCSRDPNILSSPISLERPEIKSTTHDLFEI